MKKELEQQLFENYPTLYKNREKNQMQWGFACGDGWYQLIDLLSKLIVSYSGLVQLKQVKEKFGQLRVYTNLINVARDAKVSGYLMMAEMLSATICDQCGLMGQQHRGAYVCTRCELHKPDPEELVNIEIDLPFETNNIGEMWFRMTYIFHSVVSSNKESFDLDFIEAKKEDGKLVLILSGGDEQTDAMVELLLAYANIVDEYTGEIKCIKN